MRSNKGNGSGSNSVGGYPPRSGYDELDTTLMPPRPGEAYNRGSPGPSGSMSGSQGGPPAQPFPVPPGNQGGECTSHAPQINKKKAFHCVLRTNYVKYLNTCKFLKWAYEKFFLCYLFELHYTLKKYVGRI